jgi:predicted xylose isomerase-like sugar epimerase
LSVNILTESELIAVRREFILIKYKILEQILVRNKEESNKIIESLLKSIKNLKLSDETHTYVVNAVNAFKKLVPKLMDKDRKEDRAQLLTMIGSGIQICSTAIQTG